MPLAEITVPSLPVAFLGLPACVWLTAFEARAADAGRAACYEDRVTLGGFATPVFAQFERLRDRLVARGTGPWTALRPFQEPISACHERTRPSDSI